MKASLQNLRKFGQDDQILVEGGKGIVLYK